MAESEICFPPFRLDPANERLERGGREIPLRPKTLAVLVHLAQKPDQLVRKEELLDAIWPETFVGDGVVKVCIREIREALGDDPRQPRFVETVSRRGYRFIGLLASNVAPPRPAGRRRVKMPSGSYRMPGVLGTMVGRRRELEKLAKHLASAGDGQRQLVFVTGEPGIGKTTLIDAFLKTLDQNGDQWVATGQCLESYGSGEAYMPVLETLDRLGQGRRGDEVVELLRCRAPSWLLQLPWLVDEKEQDELRQRTLGIGSARMLREMVEVLEALSDLAPLVLVLEDLHWSDGSTLDLLSALARRPEPGRLMIVGTFRPTELDDRHPLAGLRQDLRLHGLCDELELEPLTPDEVEQYLERRFLDATNGVPPGLTDLVQLRTEGHPLFVVHLTEHVVGQLERQHEQPLSTLLESGEFSVPSDLRKVIEGLIHRLTPEQQSLLEAASVAGMQFSTATAGAALELDAADLEPLAEELARRGKFLRSAGTARWPDGTLAGRYEFTHALYQDVLYTGRTETARIRWHRRIGSRIEEGFGEKTRDVAGELAMHFERGHDPGRAVLYREQAAQTAMHRSAYREAIVHLSRGLELLESLPAGLERHRQEVSLRTALGPALMATRGFAATEVRDNYTRAHELCSELRDTPELFPVLWGRWMSHWIHSEHDEAHQIGQRCLELATSTSQDSMKLLAHRMLGGTLFDVGELAAAREHLEASLALYSPQRDDRSLSRYTSDSAVFAESFRAHVLWLQGFADPARAACRRACEISRSIEHPFSQSLACGFAGTVHLLCGDLDIADEKLRMALRVSRSHGFPLFLAAAEVRYGAVLIEKGEIADGFQVLRQGIESWTATGVQQFRPLNLMLLAAGALRARRPEIGLDAIPEALRIVEEKGERWCLPELYRLRGELRLVADGDVARDAAERELEQALDAARQLGTKSWELRAATSLARLARARSDPAGSARGGHTEAARSRLAAIFEELAEGGDTADLRSAKLLLAELG